MANRKPLVTIKDVRDGSDLDWTDSSEDEAVPLLVSSEKEAVPSVRSVKLKRAPGTRTQVLIVSTSATTLVDQPTGAWSEEICAPFFVFEDRNCDVTVCTIKGGDVPLDAKSLSAGVETEYDKRMLSERGSEPLKFTCALNDLDVTDYDIVFFAGGHGTCVDFPTESVGKAVSEAYNAGRVVAAVCHGPNALVNATTPEGTPLVKEKFVACFTDQEEGMVGLTDKVPFLLESKLRELGAIVTPGPAWASNAVRDGRLVTGQNPQSSVAVAQLCLDVLRGQSPTGLASFKLPRPLDTYAGLRDLNDLLGPSSYVEGYNPSQADVLVLEALPVWTVQLAHLFPNVGRWRANINSASLFARSRWPPSVAPLWISATELCPKWLQHATGLRANSCRIVGNISNQGREATTIRFLVEGDQDPLKIILKQVNPSDARQLALSRALGLSREAIFYKSFASRLGAVVPKVYYAAGDMRTGTKFVFLEDLEGGVDSGVLFGPGNPANWKRDLTLLAAPCGNPPPSPAKVAGVTFKLLARVHAEFWRDAQLLSQKWLRGASWLLGEDRAAWEASQGYAKQCYEKAMAKRKGGEKQCNWDPLILEALETAVDGISWAKQQARLHRNGVWTLVHGDCWPGNYMWFPQAADRQVVAIDWELVGLGSGPQDLAQYVISNMEPQARRDCEERLVREYYDELIKHGVDGRSFSWETCWSEYTLGGVERWLWFLCYFGGQGEEFVPNLQFFHDQVLSFMRDHKLSPEDLVQIRP